MDIVKTLEDIRATNMAIWKEYHERTPDERWLEELRDDFEKRVRALDYVIEGMKNDAV